MTLGAYLKSEREARGFSLQEIARETKIGLRMLEAIEADQFEQLPEGHFKNAFIKSYARYIGLDAGKVLTDFHLTQGIVSTPMPIVRDSQFSSEKSERLRNHLSLAAGSLVVLGLICYLMFWGNTSRYLFQRDTPPDSAANESGPALPSAAGAGTGSPVPAPAPAEPSATTPQKSPEPFPATGPNSQASSANLKVLGELAPPGSPPPAPEGGGENLPAGGLSLRLDITEKSWIAVTAGETTLFTGLLEAGGAQTFQLDKTLKLVIGNAGGVRLSAGGKEFQPLGRSGEVRTLQISPENYLQYVQPAPPGPAAPR